MRHMRLDHIPCELTVLLGRATVAQEICETLHVGDVIVLDQCIEEGLLTRVAQTDGFLATAGLFENHKAIVIDERIYS